MRSVRRRRRRPPIPNDTALRGLAAAGLLYSYPFVTHTADASHVIAPTAQIIVRQNKVSQFFLPDEDAKSLVFDDTLLFDIDKFSGYDRSRDRHARQRRAAVYLPGPTAALTPASCSARAYQLAGENPYTNPGFDPSSCATPGCTNFNFNPRSGLETNRSEYVAGLYLSPFAGLQCRLAEPLR